MLSVKTYRNKAKAFPDLLDWAALIDSGVVLGKSGSLIAGFYYRGIDIDSASQNQRNNVTAKMNSVLARLGGGWVTWHDAIRRPVSNYFDDKASSFPDPISALIEKERRDYFTSEDTHYKSEYVLILMYTPPMQINSKIQDMIWDNGGGIKSSIALKVQESFQKKLGEIQELLSGLIKLRRMNSFTYQDKYQRTHMQDELVNYLRFLITGDDFGINIPPSGMYLDACIGSVQFYTGDTPKVEDRYHCCLSIDGFPHESYPNILEVLENLPIAYRWSTRMIYLDHHDTVKELKRYRRKWKQKSRGFISQIFKIDNGIVDEDALLMSREAEAAVNNANSGTVGFGYYTPVIVLSGTNREELLDNAKYIKTEISRLGFGCRIEDVNAVEAWLGTLAGHSLPNVRRPLIHTLNLADLLPLSYLWCGHDYNPCPFYPENSPPLLQAATYGSTPFRLNLHVNDLGHTLIFGPTGSGKSVLLSTIAAQFLRYSGRDGQGSTIFAFDKGRSMWTLAHACGANHYEVDTEGKLTLAPLSFLENESDKSWAITWISTCYELQVGSPLSPKQNELVYNAIQLLSQQERNKRSLTAFCLTVQDQEIRSALSYYTITGAMGRLLDSEEDGLHASHFNVFEIEELMSMGEKILIPVLLYLFRRFEKSLKGQPAILLLDEAWVMLGHTVFREKIKEWLKVLRKLNCVVVLATQSISDALRSGIFDVLVDSCPTKILLPNPEADKSGTLAQPGPKDLYTLMHLNEVQIDLLKNATPKKEYYYYSIEGSRIFDLKLGDITKSFVAVSDKQTIAQINNVMDEYGNEWPYVWLKSRGVNYA